MEQTGVSVVEVLVSESRDLFSPGQDGVTQSNDLFVGGTVTVGLLQSLEHLGERRGHQFVVRALKTVHSGGVG